MKIEDIFGIVIGAGVLGWLIYRENETGKIVKRIGMASDRIMDSADIQIDKALVDSITRESVQKRANRLCQNAEIEVFSQFRNEISQQVRNAVSGYASKTADIVAEEVANQAQRIDTDILMKKAIEKASNKAMQKFDKKLDEFVDGLQDRLEDDGYSRRRRVVVL